MENSFYRKITRKREKIAEIFNSINVAKNSKN